MRKRLEKIGGGDCSGGKYKGILEGLFIVILAFYPLRHIYLGLDLWDTGYNYANFVYMGTEHMDSMWLFSTYLSNAAGHLLTKLPGAGGLAGMNFYTGLFVSGLALLGYWFCTRKLKIQPWLAFLGELLAVSLCWCPTALLYNYMTYVLFLGCVILLYLGLTGERKGCLIAAGMCLGANVLVRFSNLPQMAMILAVWAYDLIVWREERKEKRGGACPVKAGSEGVGDDPEEKVCTGAGDARKEKQEGRRPGGFWKRTLAHTSWCLLGYAGTLLVLLGYIHVRYGLEEYVKGILRLFAMTDNAADYKAASMLRGVIDAYVENLYWAARIGVIAAAGTALAAVIAAVGAIFIRVVREKQIKKTGVSESLCKWEKAFGILLKMLTAAMGILLAGAMLLWLYRSGKFCSLEFYNYGSMLRPGILFMMLTMLIGVIRIFHPDSAREEKLISGMLILVILLTSLGSNNGVYPSLNNLFAAAPYTLWESWRFIRKAGKKKIAHVTLNPFPVKCILTAFLLMCCFQFGGFGAKFVFAEATGVQDVSAQVENNEVLRNIKMSREKAVWMTELGDYIQENGLQGQEVILYGKIPALSYYLQMPSAFNPWSDLRSYSYEAMEADMAELDGETPVIILENSYDAYLNGGRERMEALNVSEKNMEDIITNSHRKLQLLGDFMEENHYELVFRNGKFSVYRHGTDD